MMRVGYGGDGNYQREWTDFQRPDKLWFDKDETVFMAELGKRVSILDRSGEVLSQWGEAGEAAHQFRSYPHGIWGDSHGDLYIGEVGSDGQLKKCVRV